MASRIVALVEGEGDLAAVPVLLRKLLIEQGRYDWQPSKTHMRVGGLTIFRKRLRDFVETLRLKMSAGECHGALVLLDLEDECPKAEALQLAADIAAFGLPYPVVVVFAHREYEEWLVASLPTIAPRTPLLPDGLQRNYGPETKRGVKEWLTNKMPRGRIYRETEHQEAFTHYLDPAQARECRSFQRLEKALAELIAYAERPETERRGSTTPQPR